MASPPIRRPSSRKLRGCAAARPTPHPVSRALTRDLTSAPRPEFGLWQNMRTYFDYHHTAADTLDKVVPRELAEIIAVMAVLAYALTNLGQPLPR